MNNSEVLQEALRALRDIAEDIEFDITTTDEMRSEAELAFIRSMPFIKILIKRDIELGENSPIIASLARAILNGKTWV